jgi:L-threonylcarbamoyladenylate synthase
MLFLKVNLKKISPTSLKLIAGFLNKGGVLVLPTDTIYGLSCLADNEQAIKRIKKLKGNEKNKPLSILVSDLKMLKKYVYLSAEQEKKLKNIWAPKMRPTTVILKHRSKLPLILTGKSDGLAARLPKLDFLIKILAEVKRPLVSTILNLSGEAVVNDLKKIKDYFPTRTLGPDLVVDAGICKHKRASKIIDLREDSKLVIVRK